MPAAPHEPGALGEHAAAPGSPAPDGPSTFDAIVVLMSQLNWVDGGTVIPPGFGVGD